MPIDRSKYPPDWDKISLQVRTEAGWKCEKCGIANKTIIMRKEKGGWVEILIVKNAEGFNESTDEMKPGKLKRLGLTKIVLTTAHLDGDTRNNERSNLAALCQKCHLNHDVKQHAASRMYGRNHRENHQIKLEL
jgi:ssDNA-binding Zn-finger/Zn-ribbon topoisomerase 1